MRRHTPNSFEEVRLYSSANAFGFSRLVGRSSSFGSSRLAGVETVMGELFCQRGEVVHAAAWYRTACLRRTFAVDSTQHRSLRYALASE